MASWFVSAHGGKEPKKSKVRRFFAPTEKFKSGVTTVPSGMELVKFTQQAAIFYVGDDEFDALIAGKENDAVVTGRIR